MSALELADFFATIIHNSYSYFCHPGSFARAKVRMDVYPLPLLWISVWEGVAASSNRLKR